MLIVAGMKEIDVCFIKEKKKINSINGHDTLYIGEDKFSTKPQIDLIKEGLRHIGYTETEIEECLEDVPELTLADVNRAVEWYDNYDTSLTEWTFTTFDDYRDVIILPKFDISNLRTVTQAFCKHKKMCYIPYNDVSKITSTSYQWTNGTYACDTSGIKRVPVLSWDSLTNSCQLYAFPNITKVKGYLNPKLTNYYQMFDGALKLTFDNIDLNFDFENVQNLSAFFRNSAFTELFETNFPNVTNLQCFLSRVSKFKTDLSEYTIVAPKCTNFTYGFAQDSRVKVLPKLDFGDSLVSFANVAYSNYSVSTLPDYSNIKVTNVQYVARYSSITRIEGFDFTYLKSPVTNFGAFYATVYIKILNLGASESVTLYDFNLLMNWGSGSDENLQSLVDSLLTNSFDRAAAGYSTATIKLYKSVYNRLTEEQIEAIKAKGYDIVTS